MRKYSVKECDKDTSVSKKANVKRREEVRTPQDPVEFEQKSGYILSVGSVGIQPPSNPFE